MLKVRNTLQENKVQSLTEKVAKTVGLRSFNPQSLRGGILGSVYSTYFRIINKKFVLLRDKLASDPTVFVTDTSVILSIQTAFLFEATSDTETKLKETK